MLHATMSKAAMEILSSGSSSEAALRKKVAKIENCLWYKGGRRNLGKQGLQVKFCKPRGNSSHIMRTNAGVRVLLVAPMTTVLNGAEGRDFYLDLDQLPLLLLLQQ